MRCWQPLSRREATLVLFSLTVFYFSYNLHYSLRSFGVDPASILFSYFPGFPSFLVSSDGRKPQNWRDPLENEIFGDWAWDVGHVAGDGRERSSVKGDNRFGALWLGRAKTGVVAGEVFGRESVNGVITWWGENVPRARVQRHVPGYTIIDSVILLNRTVYLVSDDPNSLPDPKAIASWTANSGNKLQSTKWRVVSSEEAKGLLGESGGIVRGVTWMSTDTTLHPTTIVNLHRLHTTLPRDPHTPFTAHRLLFPHIPTFVPLPAPAPRPNDPLAPPRLRTPLPRPLHHPFLLKSAFPALGIEYKEDWEDYCLMEMPWMFERLVIADEGAVAGKASLGMEAVFKLDASLSPDPAKPQIWWEPVRATLHRSLAPQFSSLVPPLNDARPVVTYISRQQALSGPKLRDVDHEALLETLRKGPWQFIVVEDDDSLGEEEAGGVWDNEWQRWGVCMSAILRSSMVLGVHGPHLLSSVFMPPSPRSTVVEFFPSGTFTRDVEAAVKGVGLRYVAWWGNLKSESVNLPPSSPPPPDGSGAIRKEVTVDAQAVARAVSEYLARS